MGRKGGGPEASEEVSVRPRCEGTGDWVETVEVVRGVSYAGMFLRQS